jgi:hypothetical protein
VSNGATEKSARRLQMPSATEFANRHLITKAAAAVILSRAETPEAAEEIVELMRSFPTSTASRAGEQEK